MLNPELQADIEEQIKNAPQEIQDFLHDKYFSDTVETICRVDSLTHVQSQSLYLEVVLNVLKLTDYDNFEDAVKTELIDSEKELSEETLKQIVKDVNTYIFDKVKTLKTEVKETITVNKVEENKVAINGEVKPENVPERLTLRDTIKQSQELENKTSVEYLSKPKIFTVEGDKIENIIPSIPIITNTEVAADTVNKNPTPIVVIKSDNIIKEEAPRNMSDVYRERISPTDGEVKKE